MENSHIDRTCKNIKKATLANRFFATTQIVASFFVVPRSSQGNKRQ